MLNCRSSAIVGCTSTLTVVIELGSRARPQPAPAHVVWRSLAQPDDPTARQWLNLLDDEIHPQIVERDEPTLVVWSSLWPDRPEATMRFDIQPSAQGCRLRWTLLTTGPAPSESKLGYLRFRLNVLINGRLRLSYGQ
jgi:hypothetical protein